MDVDLALLISSVIATITLVAGTAVQVELASKQLGLVPNSKSAMAIDHFKAEVPRLRPFVRRRHRATVRTQKRESPTGAAACKRVMWLLLSWSLM